MAGIYLHIPFCRQACTYCNFHFSTTLNLKKELINAIITEIELQKGYLPEAKIETIYFGGGTPSLLSADEINRITDAINKTFKPENVLEFTLEANPDDLTQDYLQSLRNTPVDRLSIGTQSFFDSDLKYMNRAHNAQEADYAIKAAQDKGFENITIDLIYGTPGLSDQNWKANLNKVKELQIPHFSSYALTVEEDTALDHHIRTKKSAPVDAEQSASQFEILMEQAALLGFEHYEISNLSLPGHRAIHNTNYWMGVPYIGIGPSAHSFDGTNRRWNIAHNPKYIKSLLTDKQLNYEEEILTDTQRLNEYLMTALRTMWGIDMNKIETHWGYNASSEIKNLIAPFIDNGEVVENEQSLKLSNKGKLRADYIAGELFFL